MKVKKRVTHYRRSYMNMAQYVIGIIIVLVFVLSLVPGIYKNLFHIQILLILIQMIISIVRIRFLNVFFEVIMLILAIIIAIPSLFKDWFLIGILLLLINYVFIILAMVVSLIDMSTFKSSMIYKKIEIFTTGSRRAEKSSTGSSSSSNMDSSANGGSGTLKKKKVTYKKSNLSVKDADFEVIEKKKKKNQS